MEPVQSSDLRPQGVRGLGLLVTDLQSPAHPILLKFALHHGSRFEVLSRSSATWAPKKEDDVIVHGEA